MEDEKKRKVRGHSIREQTNIASKNQCNVTSLQFDTEKPLPFISPNEKQHINDLKTVSKRFLKNSVKEDLISKTDTAVEPGSSHSDESILNVLRNYEQKTTTVITLQSEDQILRDPNIFINNSLQKDAKIINIIALDDKKTPALRKSRIKEEQNEASEIHKLRRCAENKLVPQLPLRTNEFGSLCIKPETSLNHKHREIENEQILPETKKYLVSPSKPETKPQCQNKELPQLYKYFRTQYPLLWTNTPPKYTNLFNCSSSYNVFPRTHHRESNHFKWLQPGQKDPCVQCESEQQRRNTPGVQQGDSSSSPEITGDMSVSEIVAIVRSRNLVHQLKNSQKHSLDAKLHCDMILSEMSRVVNLRNQYCQIKKYLNSRESCCKQLPPIPASLPKRPCQPGRCSPARVCPKIPEPPPCPVHPCKMSPLKKLCDPCPKHTICPKPSERHFSKAKEFFGLISVVPRKNDIDTRDIEIDKEQNDALVVSVSPQESYSKANARDICFRIRFLNY